MHRAASLIDDIVCHMTERESLTVALGSMASLDGSSRHVLSSGHVTSLNVKDDGKTGAKDVPLPKYEENF